MHDAGFLASLSADVPQGYLRFDNIHYNVAGNYNVSNGIYTAPYTGLYLLNEQVSWA